MIVGMHECEYDSMTLLSPQSGEDPQGAPGLDC